MNHEILIRERLVTYRKLKIADINLILFQKKAKNF